MPTTQADKSDDRPHLQQRADNNGERRLRGRRRAPGDAEYDDFAEAIAVDLQAITAGRTGDNSIRMPPLPRRAGGNGDVAVSLLAPERHAVGPI